MASKVFWITRDDEGQEGVSVWDYGARPHKGEDGTWDWDGSGTFRDIDLPLRQFLGIFLKPGQKKKLRLVVQK